MRLLSYRRSEVKLSDHRPVTAMYMVEVEVFSPKRLQRALTFTDAEIEEEPVLTDIGMDNGISRLLVAKVSESPDSGTPFLFFSNFFNHRLLLSMQDISFWEP